MFCPYCGKSVLDGALFCTNCGKRVVQHPAAPAPVVAAPVVETPAPVVAAPVAETPAPVVAAPVVETPAPVVAAPVAETPAPVEETAELPPIAPRPIRAAVQPVRATPEKPPVSAKYKWLWLAILFTMAVALVVLAIGALTFPDANLPETPAVSIIELMASGSLEELNGALNDIDSIEEEYEAQKDKLTGKQRSAARNLLEAGQDARDNLSLNNFRKIADCSSNLIQALNEDTHTLSETTTDTINSMAAMLKAAQVALGVITLVFWAIFAVLALLTLLAGLLKNATLTILAGLFSCGFIFLLFGIPLAAGALAAYIVQAVLCIIYKSKRRAYRRAMA